MPSWPFWLIGFLTFIIIGLGFKVFQLQKRLNHSTHSAPVKEEWLGDKLTRKEREILDLILEDKSNKEIASALYIELSTVKTHINKIYSKLNVKSRQEVAALLRVEKGSKSTSL